MYKTESFFSKQYIDNLMELSSFQGNGKYTKIAENKLESLVGAPKAILTPSCTAALEMAALVIGIQPGDEVIVPSYTFVTSASAFLMHGACLKYVDICHEDFNVSFEAVVEAISDNTKAVVYVDYAGTARDIDRIAKLCRQKGIYLIEDAAQGIGASYNGKMLGSFGDLGTFSFHETKNIHCGEGGALIVNNPDLIEKAVLVRDKGTNRENYLAGEVSKYQWVDVGSSFLVSEFQSVVLSHQLDFLGVESQKRKGIYEMYFSKLEFLEKEGKLVRQKISNAVKTNGHLFFILLNQGVARSDIILRLQKKNVSATAHYEPLHTSAYGIQYYDDQILVETDKYSSQLLRLPISSKMLEQDIDIIVSALQEVLVEG
jgi:dTDP-4-amino-4,6-dideoxygalactose transaminase